MLSGIFPDAWRLTIFQGHVLKSDYQRNPYTFCIFNVFA